MISKQISRCCECPLLKHVGAKGGYPACGAAGDPLNGKPIMSSPWGARPEWCPFDLGDKIEFVFVERI